MELFLENQKVYYQLNCLFKTHNLLGIDQLTGTGKSCIAIKWILDNPTSNSLVVYTSESCRYSYYKNITTPNVSYITYSKLANMKAVDLVNFLKSNNITKFVIDEFHHAGGKEWQKGIERIIAYVKKNNLQCLGLTSTPVRHLDNFRNMFNELGFKVIKGMSLEKFLNGNYCAGISYNVLNYPSDIEGYIDRILRKNISPDKQNDLLNSIRVGFDKHINESLPSYFHNFFNSEGIATRPVQKYLCFYSNKTHLRKNTFIEDILKNYGDVTIHELTSDETMEKSLCILDEFEKATKGIHILKCINKVNEGLHPKGLTGIFFFRKTISENVFLQQFGRAIEYENKNKVYVFDLVSNIEELKKYSDFSTLFSNCFSYRVRHDCSITDISDFKGLTVTIAEMEFDVMLSKIFRSLESKELSDVDKARIDFYYNFSGVESLKDWISNIDKPASLIKAYLVEKYNYKEVLRKQKEELSKHIDTLLVKHCPHEGTAFIKEYSKRRGLNGSDTNRLIQRSKDLGVNKDMRLVPNDMTKLNDLCFNQNVPILEVYTQFPHIHPFVILKKAIDLGYGSYSDRQILNSGKIYWRKNKVNEIYNVSAKKA